MPAIYNPDAVHAYLGLVGTSRQMALLRLEIAQIAASGADVILYGEPGTGKEVVARAIHHQTHRENRANFAVINCPAISDTLAESEFFGYKGKAFTGSSSVDRQGRLAYANGGTAFFDEIGELNQALQAKLLRFLQDREISMVGDVETVPIETLVIAATNANLEYLVSKERFRPDLYDRLNVYSLTLPPLRERTEDIPDLVIHFLRMYKKSLLIGGVHEETLAYLKEQPLYGNVRELENYVRRALIAMSLDSRNGNPKVLMPHHGKNFRFRSKIPASQPYRAEDSVSPNGHVTNYPIEIGSGKNLKEIVRRTTREVETRIILDTLNELRWNRAKAAKALGISYKALLYKISDCGLVDPAFTPKTELSDDVLEELRKKGLNSGEVRDENEIQRINTALEHTGWNIGAAAKLLNTDFSRLTSRMSTYEIKKPKKD